MKKKCQVVMLPTKKANHKSICLNQVNGGLFIPERKIHGNKIFDVDDYGKNNLGTTPQNIYILSDDVIKEGDYIMNVTLLNYGTIKKVKERHKTSFVCDDNEILIDECAKKIIATTDESLSAIPKGDTFAKILPKPSNEFLKKYCDLGGINEIMVDYVCISNSGLGYNEIVELIHKEDNLYIPTKINANIKQDIYILGEEISMEKYELEYNIKIAPDNTITISPLKQKIYTEDEVIKLFNLLSYEMAQKIIGNRKTEYPYEHPIVPSEWIKNNLK